MKLRLVSAYLPSAVKWPPAKFSLVHWSHASGPVAPCTPSRFTRWEGGAIHGNSSAAILSRRESVRELLNPKKNLSASSPNRGGEAFQTSTLKVGGKTERRGLQRWWEGRALCNMFRILLILPFSLAVQREGAVTGKDGAWQPNHLQGGSLNNVWRHL